MSSGIPGFPEWNSLASTAVIMTQLTNLGMKKPEHASTTRHRSRRLMVHPHILPRNPSLPCPPTPVTPLLCPLNSLSSWLFNSAVLQMCSMKDLHQNQLKCLLKDFLNLLGGNPWMWFSNRFPGDSYAHSSLRTIELNLDVEGTLFFPCSLGLSCF